jgi:D-aminopeptidase
MEGKSTQSPGDLKAELNRRLWEEFKNPTTPEGRAVAEPIERSGFGVVIVDGLAALRALTAKELRSRGLRFVHGEGRIHGH